MPLCLARIAVVLLGVLLCTGARGDDVRVAAAASLTDALPKLGTTFARATGHQLRISFGSSGNLMRQIVQGAPFEIFLSADEHYVHRLAEQSLTQGEGDVYAIGRIVMYAPRGSDIQPAPDFSSLARAIGDGELNRLAIANPEHAPYGALAKQALINAGLWTSILPYLVLGESAAQAAQFARSGSVDAAIIPLPLAQNQTVSQSGHFALISESLYSPLQQRLVMLRDAGPAANAFVKFMGEPVAREILDRYGFGTTESSRNRRFPEH